MNRNTKEDRRITIVGLIINILLSELKFALEILGHSQSVIADAVHSLSDMGTDLLVLFGIRIWSAPADDHHPHGLSASKHCGGSIDQA